MKKQFLKYKQFLNESQQDFSPEELEKFKKYELDISKVTKNSDGSIDYDGNVNLSDKKLTELPFNFRKVTGYFDCDNNQLTSLEGAPREVRGYFRCGNNPNLKSLEGSPREVTGNFWCDNNQLTSLEGAPREVGRNFYCDNNQLTSLKGAPQIVGREFRCQHNKLTSLEGAPREVRGDFRCHDNQLLSLKVPSKVLGELYIYNNDFKDSLKFFIEEKSSKEQREILNELREFDSKAYRKVLQSLKDQGIELESVSKEEQEWNEEAKGTEDTGLEF